MNFTLKKVNQHAVRLTFVPSDLTSKPRQHLTIPACNIGLEQQADSGEPWYITDTFEFGALIDGEYFHYSVGRHASDGSWEIETWKQGDTTRLSLEENIPSTAGLFVRLAKINRAGEIVSNPGVMYDKYFSTTV